MVPFSRREFLQRLTFGFALLPPIARSPRSLLGQLLFDPDGPPVPAKPIPHNPFRHEGRSVVLMIHGRDPHAMLLAGLELLGGLDPLRLQGKRVLIKPNVLNDRPPPTTTNPAVVGAVVETMTRYGVREVIVADGSGIIRLPTAKNLDATGMRGAAEMAGARVLAIEEHPWVCVEPRGAKAIPRYFVSRPVYDADVVVNVPVIKTHRFAEYSCSLKNIVGVIHPRYRPSVTFLAGNWHERIAELNLAVHPQLTIADGTTVMIDGGPTSGTAAPADILLFSGDRVATDVIALGILRAYGAWAKVQGFHIAEQRQVKRAAELGLGVRDAQHIELISRSIEGKAPAFERLVERVRRDVFGANRERT